MTARYAKGVNSTMDDGAIVAVDQFGVRRLTPMECERLQGAEDGWTEFGLSESDDKVKQSDSQRYRQLGNSVAVPVVAWIAKRLVEVDESTPGR